jgi:hypothetical protein
MSVGMKTGSGVLVPPRVTPGATGPAQVPSAGVPDTGSGTGSSGGPAADRVGLRAPEAQTSTLKTVGHALSSTASAIGELARVAAKHPVGTIGVAGMTTFIVGGLGLVSPFVGLMGGVVGVTALINGGNGGSSPEA